MRGNGPRGHRTRRQRILLHERLCFRDALYGVPAEELRLDVPLAREGAKLVEPRRKRLDSRFLREIGERRAAPKRQGLGESLAGDRTLPRAEGAVAVVSESLELAEIEPVTSEVKDVSGALGGDGVPAQHFPELRDVPLDEIRGCGRRVLAPQLVHQSQCRDEAVRLSQQCGKHSPLAWAPEFHGPSGDDHLERPEQPVLDHFHPDERTTQRPGFRDGRCRRGQPRDERRLCDCRCLAVRLAAARLRETAHRSAVLCRGQRRPGQRGRVAGAEPVTEQGEVALPKLRGDLPSRIGDASRGPEKDGDILVDDVRAQLAGDLRALDQALDEGPQPGPCSGDQLLGAELRTEHLGEAAVRGLQADDIVEVLEEALPGIVRVESLDGRGHDSFEMILEDRVDQSILRREASVERPDADAGAGGDLLDADVDPVLGERPPGSLENALTVLSRIASQRATTRFGISGGCDPLMIASGG